MNNYENFNAISDRIREGEVEDESIVRKLMQKVYTWMAVALAVTGLTAWYVASSPTMLQAIFGNQIVFWGLIILEVGFVFGISRAINRLSLTMATLLFMIYSVINGVTLSVLLLAYTLESIGSVFFITAGTFGAMAFIGYTTKTDLTKFGQIMVMALIGLIIATVVNLFLHSSGFAMILNYLGVLIFVGLTAYDVQKLKNLFSQSGGVTEEWQKLAILGALTLYLDFVNLFIKLLAIMGKRK